MTITTARKQGKCIQCNGIIEIGERHISESFKKNGRYITEKLHFDCEQAYNKIQEDKRYNQFSDSINEHPEFYQAV